MNSIKNMILAPLDNGLTITNANQRLPHVKRKKEVSCERLWSCEPALGTSLDKKCHPSHCGQSAERPSWGVVVASPSVAELPAPLPEGQCPGRQRRSGG